MGGTERYQNVTDQGAKGQRCDCTLNTELKKTPHGQTSNRYRITVNAYLVKKIICLHVFVFFLTTFRVLKALRNLTFHSPKLRFHWCYETGQCGKAQIRIPLTICNHDVLYSHHREICLTLFFVMRWGKPELLEKHQQATERPNFRQYLDNSLDGGATYSQARLICQIIFLTYSFIY